MFNKGDHVRLNEQGKTHHIAGHNRTGIVAYQPAGISREVAILWYGNKKPTYYDMRLVELVEEAQQ